jgi:hypothetical protein
MVVSAVASLWIAGSALAHTPLVSSAPADGSAVSAPVREMVVEFREGVRLTALSLASLGGEKKALGPLPSEVATRFAVAVEDDLSPGDYALTWRAVGGDTHIISGQIRFSVAAAGSN